MPSACARIHQLNGMRTEMACQSDQHGILSTISRETLDKSAINMTEAILEPELPIIDPHHHLWDRTTLLPQLPPATHAFEAIIRQTPRYLLD